MGDKLRHIHLCDGSGSLDEGKIFDEHLVPAAAPNRSPRCCTTSPRPGWDGSIAAEVMTRKARGMDAKTAVLRETLEFAREHIAAGEAAAASARPSRRTPSPDGA